MARSRPRSAAARAKQRELMSEVRAANPEQFEKPPRDPGDIRDLGWRYNFLRIFFWLYALGAFLGAITSYRLIVFLDDAFSGRFTSEAEMMTRANNLDQTELIRAVATAVIFIVCTIAYGRFVVRAAKNLNAAGSREMAASPHSLVWWYFVPFANLAMPVQGVAEVTRGTKELSGEAAVAPASVGLWWAAWVGGLLVNAVANGLARASNVETGLGGDFDMYLTAQWFGLVASLLFAVAAILFVRVAKRIHEGQSRIMGKGVVEAFD